MRIDDKIRDEKLKCKINREAAKMLALSSAKIDKNRIIEQAKFTYSPFGKAFEKQIKTSKD